MFRTVYLIRLPILIRKSSVKNCIFPNPNQGGLKKHCQWYEIMALQRSSIKWNCRNDACIYQLFFHPTPHCFIAITKAPACGWKEPLLPHPLHDPVRGRGKGGASSTALKICLIKTWVTLKWSSKAYWKWPFWWKPLKQKSLLRFFARHFLFQKKYFASTI
jgi:hypothetical protein